MFILKFSSSDFEQQLHELASSVTNHHYGKKVVLKDEVGTGYFKVLKFPNQVKTVITNYVVNQDFLGVRENVKDSHYILHINQVNTKDEFSVLMNNKEIDYDNRVYAAVFLTDSAEPFGLKGTKGACFSQLKIMIPKDLMHVNIGEAFNETILQQYFNLGEGRLNFDSFDDTYRTLVDKVMNTEDNIFYLAITQSIINVIMERFFCRMGNKLQRRSDGKNFLEQVA
jgi:hypothetical protein